MAPQENLCLNISMTPGDSPRKVHSRAPTRIDLAGGTVDIWPIHLLLGEPTTINVGIDLFAETTLEESTAHAGVILRAQDQGTELRLPWEAFEARTGMPREVTPQLELHYKLLRHFVHERKKRPTGGLSLSTVAKSPAGAGLGGSSALSVSMIGALATWSRGRVDFERDGEKLIEITRDVETTVIQVPAGLQDYYGAMFGGLQSLRWGAGSHSRERLPQELLEGIDERLILFYSGQSRNSGINNWALFKAFIDKTGGVREQFAAIAAATSQLETALRARDWAGAGRAIEAEWQTRKGLAPGISTAEMNAAFAVAAEEGVTAGKICGAGGGGCFFVFAPKADPGLRDKLIARITGLGGIRHLPCRAVPRGVEVQDSRA